MPVAGISNKPKTQRERALENGISRWSQQGLDKIAKFRPELLNKISKGELSIKESLRLCDGSSLKNQQSPPIENLKKAFSKLSEEEKDQFRIWLREYHLISQPDYTVAKVISTNV